MAWYRLKKNSNVERVVFTTGDGTAREYDADQLSEGVEVEGLEARALGNHPALTDRPLSSEPPTGTSSTDPQDTSQETSK